MIIHDILSNCNTKMQISCEFMLWNAASQKIRFQMVSADALTIFSGIIILFRNSGKSADFPELPFHGRGRNGKQHLQRRFLRKCGAAGNESSQAHCVRQPCLRGFPPLFAKKSQDLAKQAGQNRKIRASAHFNELKTYKSAKKISLFLVRLLSGLRLLYGRNLLL